MTQLIILDTETSGLGKHDKIIELAMVSCTVDIHTNSIEWESLRKFSNLCACDTLIHKEASKIHKITNDDLKQSLYMKETEVYKLFETINIPQNIVVMHNAFFDLVFLRKDKVQVKCQLIDTLTCARHIQPDLKSYKLNDLVPHMTQTHRALGDCEMVLHLIGTMLQSHTFEQLIDFTSRPLLAFGKHKNVELTNAPKDYLKWLLENSKNLDLSMKVMIKSILVPHMITENDKKFLGSVHMSHFVSTNLN